MHKVKIEIEYDNETEAALISVNGSIPVEYKSAHLLLRNLAEEDEVEGWRKASVAATLFSFTAMRAANA